MSEEKKIDPNNPPLVDPSAATDFKEPMDSEAFKKAGYAVVDSIAQYLEKGVLDYPVFSQVAPGDITASLPVSPPTKGESFDDLLEDVNTKIKPGLTHWQHPSWFAFFPANSSPASILGDMLCSGLGVQGMIWNTSPACTEVETVMMDWLAQILKLPAPFHSNPASAAAVFGEDGTEGAGQGGGVIQGTASEGVLVALVAARHQAIHAAVDAGKYKDLDEARAAIVIYASDQTHSSLKKAAMIAGLNVERQLRVIDTTDSQQAMTAAAFKAAVDKDLADGLLPTFVCTTVGTTSTTAVDDIEGIGKVCVAHGIWGHLDAAFAGSAAVCPEFRYLLNGVEYMDSALFNPHKWLLVSFDCSALWVRQRKYLIDALSVLAPYYKNKATESGAVIDYRDWQVPLGRRFRALKLWAVMRTYGVEGMQAFIRSHFAMAQWLEDALKADERFTIVTPRTSTLLVFALKAGNEATVALGNKMNSGGTMGVTPSKLGDASVIRFSIGTRSTKLEHVKAAWAETQKLATEILEGSK